MWLRPINKPDSFSALSYLYARKTSLALVRFRCRLSFCQPSITEDVQRFALFRHLISIFVPTVFAATPGVARWAEAAVYLTVAFQKLGVRLASVTVEVHYF